MVLRCWVYLGSAALLAGMFTTGQIWGIRLFDTWFTGEDHALVAKVCVAVALVSAVTASVPHPVARGTLLTVASLAALALYVTVAFSAYYGDGVQVAVQITIGSALVVSSNHVLRRHPELRFPRILSGLGGTGILLAFLAEGQAQNRTLVRQLVQYGIYGREWAAALFATLLLIFGILGVTNAVARAPAPMRRRVISGYGYGLLTLFPFALAFHATSSISEWTPHLNPNVVSFLFRLWMLGTGHAILLAAGLVTGLDALAEPAASPGGNPASARERDILKPGDTKSL